MIGYFYYSFSLIQIFQQYDIPSVPEKPAVIDNGKSQLAADPDQRLLIFGDGGKSDRAISGSHPDSFDKSIPDGAGRNADIVNGVKMDDAAISAQQCAEEYSQPPAGGDFHHVP